MYTVIIISSSVIESQIIFIIVILLSGFVFFAFKNSLGIDLLNKLTEKIKFLNKFKVDKKEFVSTSKILIQSKTLFQLLSITFLSKIIPMVDVYFVF